MSIEIQVGDFYRTRRGIVCQVTAIKKNSSYPEFCFHRDGLGSSYDLCRSDGRVYLDREDPCDLIEEVTGEDIALFARHKEQMKEFFSSECVAVDTDGNLYDMRRW